MTMTMTNMLSKMATEGGFGGGQGWRLQGGGWPVMRHQEHSSSWLVLGEAGRPFLPTLDQNGTGEGVLCESTQA